MTQGGSGGGWGPPPGGSGWGPPGGFPPPSGFPPPGGGGFGAPPPPGPPGRPPGQPPPWGPPPGGFAPIPQGYPPGYSPRNFSPGTNWSPGDAVGFAWDRIKADPVTIIGAFTVGWILAAAPGFFGDFVAGLYSGLTDLDSRFTTDAGKLSDPGYLVIRGISMALNYVAQAFMMAGMTSFALKVARGERYAFADIASGGRWFLPSLAIFVLTGFGVLLGLLFLIIPGIFLALAWSLSLPAAVDRDLRAIDAMKESFRLTEGHRGSILMLFLLLGGIGILGLCACFVGIFVSVAIAELAVAWVYVQLSGRYSSDA